MSMKEVFVIATRLFGFAVITLCTAGLLGGLGLRLAGDPGAALGTIAGCCLGMPLGIKFVAWYWCGD